MDDMGDRPAPGQAEPVRSARSGSGFALVQAGLAGLVGAVLAPTASWALVAGLFGGWSVFLFVTAAYVAFVVGALAVVALVAPEESWLTGSIRGRVLWGVLVGFGGYALWLVGWQISDEAGLGFSRSSSVWIPVGIVPFAVVAGLLLRRWYLSLGSLAVFAGVGLFLLHALAVPMPSDRELRLNGPYAPRGVFLVASVPGYHVVPDQSTWLLRPDDAKPSAAPINVTLVPQPNYNPESPDCQPPQFQICEVERPGFYYTRAHDGSTHGYWHRLGEIQLTLTGPTSIDRAVMRESILAAHPVEPAGSYTTTVPGYTGSYVSPAGVSFSPDDKTLLPEARNIDFMTQPVVVGCGAEARVCEIESPELRYESSGADHRYVRVVGTHEVSVKGGMGVSRDVLRSAALAAHQASEDELLAMLPPAGRPRPGSLMGAVRELAHAIFGR